MWIFFLPPLTTSSHTFRGVATIKCLSTFFALLRTMKRYPLAKCLMLKCVLAVVCATTQTLLPPPSRMRGGYPVRDWMCAGRYAAATERSGVAAKCLLPGYSAQGIPEECDNGRSFSFFGKIISGMLIGSLFPADAACRVPTVFRDLGGCAGMRRWRALGLGHKKRRGRISVSPS